MIEHLRLSELGFSKLEDPAYSLTLRPIGIAADFSLSDEGLIDEFGEFTYQQSDKFISAHVDLGNIAFNPVVLNGKSYIELTTPEGDPRPLLDVSGVRAILYDTIENRHETVDISLKRAQARGPVRIATDSSEFGLAGLDIGEGEVLLSADPRETRQKDVDRSHKQTEQLLEKLGIVRQTKSESSNKRIRSAIRDCCLSSKTKSSLDRPGCG